MRHSTATILAVILMFFAIIVLSHTPINMMAHKVEAKSVANMKSCESNNPNAIEVDGICFETLISEEVVYLPNFGEETPVKFGVRITNHASKPYRFDLPFFWPEILNLYGESMQIDSGKNASREVEETDIPLIMPRDSLDFLINAKLSWYSRNCLRLSGNAIYGAIWTFWNIQPGQYQVRLTYENQRIRKQMFNFEGRAEIDGFWTGQVKTHFASLRFQ
ncbi:hypothetical protein JMG10_40905 [Nostoc ellipsosporum NOK]|nr:hypothetical protein [Nostoc ellipsosporum NOK]